ncbi:HAD family hydrolase [Bombilactobacillus bombi]|uniref:HAD family hydrolase n=1 Tax=Bombilactobacillus bombi TaxID=1303590 RepID=UPI0015E5FF83|nr:HAD family hydrolase [Bombilactobacillus bombi]
MIQAVLFDIDGTLLDTEKQVIAGLQQALKAKKNLTVTPEQLFYTLGIPGLQVAADFADNPQEAEQILQCWEQNMRTNFQSVTIFSGIMDLLKQLQQRQLSLAIVTSKTRAEFDDEVKNFGFEQYFQTVITASDTKEHKPHPAPILKGLERLQNPASDALYVGDAIYDQQCAHAAHVRFARAVWGSKDNPEFKQADYQLQHPQDLIKIVDDENN